MCQAWQRRSKAADGVKAANQLTPGSGVNSGLSRYAQCNHKGPRKRKEREI